jgi:ABC-type uncharacterized transport system permease subunit
MSRSQRIRIVSAIFAGIAGVAVCYFGPALTPLLWRTFFSSRGLSQSESHDLFRLNIAVAGISFAVAAIAFLYVFVAWARWFIGPHERS